MPIHTDQVPDVTVSVGLSPYGRLPDHHTPPTTQNCLLNGQVIGMSRGFHWRKFTKRCGIIVTHLTLGLRGTLLQCKRDGHLGLGKRSREWAEQTRVSRANETRGRGGFCQTKLTSTGTGYLAGTELSSQLRNPVGSFALQEKCFYCVKTKKRFSFVSVIAWAE